MARICFICDTAYQVFNGVNIKYNSVIKETDEVDVYIQQIFYDSENIVKRLKEERLFNNVYMVHKREGGMLGIFNRIIGLIYPKSVVGEMLGRKDIFKRYSMIFMAIPSAFSIAIARCNPDADVIYYDEGIGSYSANITKTVKKLNMIIYQFFSKSKNFVTPIELYVNNKELCKSTVAPCIEQLPSLQDASEEFWDLIKRVFGYKNSEVYAKYPFVYLMQPRDGRSEIFEEINSEIEKILAKRKEKCIVRLHPRQQEADVKGMKTDCDRNIWELLCAEKISNQHLLIGMCSTAQLIPKMLFNKEPYLLFTYRLYRNVLLENEFKRFEDNIENIRMVYSEPEKIFLPDSYEELEQCLKIGELQIEKRK